MAKAEVWRFVDMGGGYWALCRMVGGKIGTGVRSRAGGIAIPHHAGVLVNSKVGGTQVTFRVFRVRTPESGKRRIALEIVRQIVAKGGTATIRPAPQKKGWRRG